MARRRPTPAKASKKNNPSRHRSEPSRYRVESLENRRLFVVLHGGDVFEFYADATHMERVVVTGNTTVELFGTFVDPTAGLTPGDTVPLDSMDGVIFSGPDSGTVGIGLPAAALPNNTGGGGGSTQTTPIEDIYAIYVTQADANSSIAIADVPPLGTPGNRFMTPFDSSLPLLVEPTSGGTPITVTAPSDGGGVIIGARAVAPMGVTSTNFPTNEPIYYSAPLPSSAATVSPGVTRLGAGLTVTPGNNLGSFMLGGTMMGTVAIHGSIGLFYAGWILTGAADGTGSALGNSANFVVDGDMHTLLSNNSFGTNTDSGLTDLGFPRYLSGFSLRVGGKVGMVKSMDSVVGSIDVTNSPTASSNLDGVPYQQIDLRGGTDTTWDQGVFGSDPLINDQTELQAQFLGPIDSSGTVQVTGEIQGESATVDKSTDFYAVPLMAGQTVTAQVVSSISGSVLEEAVALGVFNGQNQLVASDYNGTDLLATNGQPFQFTAQTPGIYYFAVSGSLNNTFAASFGTLFGDLPYTLTITNVGNLGLAGVTALTNVLTFGETADTTTANLAGIQVVNGDLGAVYAGNLVISDDEITSAITANGVSSSGNVSFYVDNGNLRAVQATSIGNGTGAPAAGTASSPSATAAAIGEWPDALVPNGSVGLLRATGTSNAAGQGGTDVLAWNFDLTAALATTTLTPGQATTLAIGGDYQMVDAANVFGGDLIADGNIGTIRAANMQTSTPSYFQVNALDDTTKHGTIDLIDVSGDMGILGGGPAIVTGPGGNCRYVHVGGIAFRDTFFGGGLPETTLFQPGETALITDDSGANVSMTPESPADSLLVTTLPIRGSGGSAIVSVEVTNTTTPANAEGLNITTSGGGSAEIGAIILDGTGTALVPGSITTTTTTGNTTTTTTTTGGTTTTTTTTTGSTFPPPGSPGGAPVAGPGSSGNKFTLPKLPTAPTLATTGNPLDINISGSVKTDIYSITGSTGVTVTGVPTVVNTPQVTSIRNSTPGEIVDLALRSLGTASISGALGIALEHNTASAVLGNIITTPTGMAASYPLNEVSSLARITLGAISISAGTLGNVLIGTIAGADTASGTNELTPRPIPDAAPPAPTTGTAGQLGSLHAGAIVGSVVVEGSIGSASAGSIGWQGSGARGSPGIFSTSLIGPVTVGGDVSGQIISTVGQVGLTIINGSLNNATIADYSRFDFAEARRLESIVPTSATPLTAPELDLGGIAIEGKGGIIGSLIVGEHLGPVSVPPSGFGIFDSTFSVLGDGTMIGISAGGYGIRDSLFEGGASFGAITAIGNGSEVPVTNFSSSVRNSETGALFDPVTGEPISFLNDLDIYLGTSPTAPRIVGVTESGVIENTTIVGSRDLGSLNAWSIDGRVVTSTTNPFDVVTTLTSVDVADSVAQINVTGPIDNFAVTTGRTSKYNFGGNVRDFSLTVAGLIGSLVFKSSLLGTSSIVASGPGGRIGSLVVHGNFSGFIRASTTIGSIQVLGSLSGLVQAQSLGTLKLTGGLGNGSLQIIGNVGTIMTTGDLGIPGNMLTINGSLKVLKIGRNLNTGITIGKNLGKLIVAGSLLDAADINIASAVTLLQIGGDVQAGAILKAHIIKRRLIRGLLLGTITTA
jgi:hypothetical protein